MNKAKGLKISSCVMRRILNDYDNHSAALYAAPLLFWLFAVFSSQAEKG